MNRIICLSVCFFVFFRQVEGSRPMGWTDDNRAVFERAKSWAIRHQNDARMLIGNATEILKSEEDRTLYRSALNDAFLCSVDNSSACIGCQLLIGLFKVALSQNGYAAVEETLISVCELLLLSMDPLTPANEVCDGVIRLQAPHVARIVTTPPIPTNVEACEFINACLPPPTATAAYRLPTRRNSAPPVGERQKQQQQQRQTKRRRRAARGGGGGGGKGGGRGGKIMSANVSNDTIRIVQMTDIHLEKDYATNSQTDCHMLVCCQEYQGQGDAGHYGSYDCNLPQRTMELFFEQVNALAPDFIIFSGDIPPHTVWNETLESQLECTETLTSTLQRLITAAPIYPCIGNHEMYPTNLFSASLIPNATGVMLDEFSRLWTPLAQFSPEEIGTMREAGYYTKLVGIGNLRIVAMNTLYLYTYNFYNIMNHNDLHSNGEVTRLKEKIVSILEQARASDEKVIFVGHHVPGNSDSIVKASRWYNDLMVNFSDVITLHISGHTHSDEYRLFLDEYGDASSMVYVSPSMDTHGYRNPSLRIFHLDRTTYEVLDYEQHFFDLKSVGPGETPTIVKLYSAKDEYALPDLSPASWLQLLDRFRSDPDLIQRHRSHGNANSRDFSSYSCSGECVEDYICRMLHSTYDEYKACTEQQAPVYNTQMINQ